MFHIIKFYFFLILFYTATSQDNNVCPTYADYYTLKSNPRCSYNPDLKDMPDLVTQHGYPLELYNVTTEDGYILDLYRIPNYDTFKVVFLQHPATASCAMWVDKGDENSLAYLLYKEGYDVWLGNSRGSFYGRKHESLNPDTDSKFWNFSYHEMGVYDLSAMFEFVASRTDIESTKMTYVSHSLGSNVFAIYASLFPQRAQELIKLAVLMSPSLTFQYAKTPLRVLTPFAQQLYDLAMALGLTGEFLGHNNQTLALTASCRSYGMTFCLFLNDFIGGFDHTFSDPSTTPIMFWQNPAGLSLKTLVHFAQDFTSERFAQFDYGSSRNMEVYGMEVPPAYAISDIRVPIHIFVGGNDFFASVEDGENFYADLPESSRKNFTIKEQLNHYHFIYGKNLKEVVLDEVMDSIESVN